MNPMASIGLYLATNRVMKPAQLGSLNRNLPSIEEDLAARMHTLFGRCPALHGFTVLDRSLVPGGMRVAALERGLFVAGIGIYPEVGADQCERIYDEISVALLDFMLQRPEAREVLRGRTFARAFH
jgi:hypothetical protein